ncbi:phospholipase D family protein [Histidinibacterium aquaticum]|uniref:Phospholipase D n=1 Tax=Histidinibacterium aquaticum TaxID=2613962 RepID=A0A5J5GIG2_9RHOB|nr:phospholipase D-like domain-containing protein [Histidinibacterium aquaticum]KAA9007945.1 phospholipase [Histidinibacterium aquaticum]
MASLVDTRILLTAQEAYPAFEEKVAAAQSEIYASFRIFDPFTRLRSKAGRALGKDWFELIAAKLADGVAITLLLTDFDPVARPDLHRQTWASLRALWAAAEISGKPHLLTAKALMHPARTGGMARLLFWPKIMSKLKAEAKKLAKLDETAREEALRLSPGLRPLLTDNGTRPRRWPPPELIPATHHQKLAVIDREWLYIGGLDLDERRYDTPTHERAPEKTWHDVQVLTRGDVVRIAREHLEHFQQPKSVPPQRDDFLRTISVRRRRTPFWSVSPKNLVKELCTAHLDGIRSAEDFIYIETQFLRSRKIASALVKAAERNPSLHLLAILPAAPEDVAFEGNKDLDARYGEFLQARAIARISRAFGERCFFAAPARAAASGERRTRRDHLDGAPIIYVHAKIACFDGATGIVSSANLNGRSLGWDTEAGLRLRDPELAATLQQRCLAHWAGPDRVFRTEGTGEQIVDAVRSASKADRDRAPEDRKGLLLPYDVAPARRFGRNLPGMPEGMV